MVVLFTHSSLTLTLSAIKSAYYLWEPGYRHLEDSRLGYDVRHGNHNEDFYWERVRDRLGEIIVKNPSYTKAG